MLNLNTKKVFSEVKGEIYIGGEKIKPDIRSLLKEQAGYLDTSQLWEVLCATIEQESAEMALKTSTEWNHVLSAKMLHHWNFVFKNMINKLKQ